MIMTNYVIRGKEIRDFCKSLVLDFMSSSSECQPGKIGMKQSQIFKNCGFDWGDYPSVTSSNQQYWIVAILSELKEEGKVERVSQSGPWRLHLKY
jgi:hypothetical protein